MKVRPLFMNFARSENPVWDCQGSIMQLSAEATIEVVAGDYEMSLTVRGPTEKFEKVGVSSFSLGDVIEVPS